jgi:hypothetical protein
MKFTQLTTSQAAAFQQLVQSMHRFLLPRRKRLDARGFDSNGKPYHAVSKAYDAMYQLHVELHYESCGRGVGRPLKSRDADAR